MPAAAQLAAAVRGLWSQRVALPGTVAWVWEPRRRFSVVFCGVVGGGVDVFLCFFGGCWRVLVFGVGFLGLVIGLVLGGKDQIIQGGMFCEGLGSFGSIVFFESLGLSFLIEALWILMGRLDKVKNQLV